MGEPEHLKPKRLMTVRGPYLICLIATFGWLNAFAHNPTSSFGLSAAAPQSVIGLESQWAQYPKSLDGRGGQYSGASLRLEYALNERISVGANLPFAGIWRKDSAAIYGVGDVELNKQK